MTRLTQSTPVLVLASLVAVLSALAADLGSNHPTHLLVAAHAAVVMWWLCRRLRHHFCSARAIVTVTLVLQPLLHFGSGPEAAHLVDIDDDGVLHLLVNAAQPVVTQIVVPAAALMALTALIRLLGLILRVLRPSITPAHGAVDADLRVPGVVRVGGQRHSLIAMCGWTVAAIRGPPV
ncbi:hypothetical protein EV383_2460 [Pseudonocardia sediminis]|uniref:Uncharacterized protein n=1 Tax=Pseudonocardia sediminis TaxID=1397368 RepID=A0A4Q7UUY4_PSEST|nr:hypothetical protein [Pseudonocardia sediminis]RZT85586.1 hypothetical protein EV383_2460 [Pseudonocardia sediminis]